MKNFMGDRLTVVVMLLSFSAVFYGIFARFLGLGDFSFASDEYYLAQAVRNTVEHGISTFECGGYYGRGIVVQYLGAFVVGVLKVSPEIGLRSITAIFNILTLPALLLLANRLTNVYGACAIAILFSLSILEIETARYFRMYSPFQMLFCWYTWFLYLMIVDGKQKSFLYMLAISGVSIFFYSGGIILAALNLLPFFTKKLPLRSWQFAAALSVMVFVFAMLKVVIIGGAQTEVLPEFLQEQIESVPDKKFTDLQPNLHIPIDPPTLLLLSFDEKTIWKSIFYALVFFAGIALIWLRKYFNTGWDSLCYYGVLIFFAAMNQFGFIVLLILVILLLRLIDRREIFSKVGGCIAGIVILFGLFWLTYAMMTVEWRTSVLDAEQNPFWKSLVVFFKYPDVYVEIFNEWFIAVPNSTLIYLSVLGFLIFLVLINKIRNPGLEFLLALFVINSIFVAISFQLYAASRYSLYYFPIVLLVMVFLFVKAGQLFSEGVRQKYYSVISLMSLVSVVIWFSEDYNYRHITDVNDPKVFFRLEYDYYPSYHFWFHADFKTPAEFVNSRLSKDDVIITSMHPVHFYLNKLDYFYLPANMKEFIGNASCGGTKDRWTNASLLYNKDMLLRSVLNNDKDVWLIFKSNSFGFRYEVETELTEKFKSNIVYTSEDGRINVYHIRSVAGVSHAVSG